MKATHPISFASAAGARRQRSERACRARPADPRMLLPLGMVAGLIALWSAAAPLSGAVVANGQVKVELNRKTVQHQEGGIVREILVRDGQKVRAGQPLVVVGDVRSDSELSLLQDQLRAARIRSARAEAEAALQSRFTAPADLAGQPDAAEHLAREHALFTARRRTLDEQIAALEKQIREAHAQARALEAQIAATETSARLSAEELEMNNKLVRDGFINRTRLLELQRGASDYAAHVGEYRSDLALARAARRASWKPASRRRATNTSSRRADELKEASAKVARAGGAAAAVAGPGRTPDGALAGGWRGHVHARVGGGRSGRAARADSGRRPGAREARSRSAHCIRRTSIMCTRMHPLRSASALSTRAPCRCCRRKSCSSRPTASPIPTPASRGSSRPSRSTPRA